LIDAPLFILNEVEVKKMSYIVVSILSAMVLFSVVNDLIGEGDNK
jgi:hypothetical protein